jgi:exodeoxyribonuclease-3
MEYQWTARHVGWRIDYFLVSKALVPRVRDVIFRDEILGFDHCPVELDIEEG